MSRRTGPKWLFTLLAGLGGGTACHAESTAERAPPPVVVRCAAPKLAAIDETLVLRGRVEAPPGGELAIASQVPGRIVSLAVHEGQTVARGELIATVDDAQSRDSLRQAEATVAQARAGDADATAALARTRTLVERGIAAQQELTEAEARAAAARASAEAARSSASLAEHTLARVAIRSAFDGTVTRVMRGVGALVDGTEATPVVELTSSGALELVASATEGELALIATGQKVTGQYTDGTPFEGAVLRRGAALDPTTGLGTVRIALASAGTSTLVGALGRATVVTRHRDAVPLLPTAVLRGAVADGAEVAVCQGGTTALRSLVVGWRDEQRFEVLAGLAKGERVALDHVLGLEDGTVIEEAK